MSDRVHTDWLLELTALETAAGREDAVIEWIERWVDARPDLERRTDDAGNILVRAAARDDSMLPVVLTAHMDHPAFVVERVEGDEIHLTFRGGVRDPYFVNAPITIHTGSGDTEATVQSAGKADPLRKCVAACDGGASGIKPGDIGRWTMPPAQIKGGMLYTNACDDLAALCAALETLERLRTTDKPDNTQLLLTRAEEVGFIGAIAACKLGTLPDGAKVIALENSRAFAESPIGAGPIVRVGDKMSTFSPSLTRAISVVAEQLAKDRSEQDAFLWQRKLMPGGSCEASVFCAYGHDATCVCLPLGNYHNMAGLADVERGDERAIAEARCAQEIISIDDYEGLVDLLEACALSLGETPGIMSRLDKIYADASFVLER
jgi:endoglucanase